MINYKFGATLQKSVEALIASQPARVARLLTLAIRSVATRDASFRGAGLS